MANDQWIIQAREGFAVGGERLELRDESNALINLADLGVTLRITGWQRSEEFSLASGNFAVVPPVSPATYPTAWTFTLSVEDVTSLKSGRNDFEVLISDQDDILIGEFNGVIEKKKA